MASENKKNKSRNSPWNNGFEKMSFKMKRFGFFNKKQRMNNKKIKSEQYD